MRLAKSIVFYNPDYTVGPPNNFHKTAKNYKSPHFNQLVNDVHLKLYLKLLILFDFFKFIGEKIKERTLIMINNDMGIFSELSTTVVDSENIPMSDI